MGSQHLGQTRINHDRNLCFLLLAFLLDTKYGLQALVGTARFFFAFSLEFCCGFIAQDFSRWRLIVDCGIPEDDCMIVHRVEQRSRKEIGLDPQAERGMGERVLDDLC